MIYRCVVVDDEELGRHLVERHLAELEDFVLVASCGSAIEASKVLKTEKVDLLFLDIEMPVLKGTDFYKSLIPRPHVIFTTAYRDYAIEGFELSAVDYLLKPITFERFFKAIEKFLSQQRVPEQEVAISPSIPKDNFIFIRKDRKQVKLMLDSVLYIESLKDYVKIHLREETHTIKHSITSFQTLLGENFMRVHRSFIVNIDRITSYGKHDVEIGKIEIPIGDSYRKIVDGKFRKYRGMGE